MTKTVEAGDNSDPMITAAQEIGKRVRRIPKRGEVNEGLAVIKVLRRLQGQEIHFKPSILREGTPQGVRH